MRVEVKLKDGNVLSMDVVYVIFIRTCTHCQEEFRTNDPRKEYCKMECREGAKYERRLGR